jgi:hypothetical protein
VHDHILRNPDKIPLADPRIPPVVPGKDMANSQDLNSKLQYGPGEDLKKNKVQR